eukprot:6214360-Pleurochrysis_carterae.AAC.3
MSAKALLSRDSQRNVHLSVIGLQKLEILVVLVADDLAAREASNWDDHRKGWDRASAMHDVRPVAVQRRWQQHYAPATRPSAVAALPAVGATPTASAVKCGSVRVRGNALARISRTVGPSFQPLVLERTRLNRRRA